HSQVSRAVLTFGPIRATIQDSPRPDAIIPHVAGTASGADRAHARAREIAREIGAKDGDVETVAVLLELGIEPDTMRRALERGRPGPGAHRAGRGAGLPPLRRATAAEGARRPRRGAARAPLHLRAPHAARRPVPGGPAPPSVRARGDGGRGSGGRGPHRGTRP